MNLTPRERGVYKVRQFEEAFAGYLGCGHALAVTSGSAALKVALTALDVGPGDEVIVPAFDFIATYEAVLETGAIPDYGRYRRYPEPGASGDRRSTDPPIRRR